MTMKGVSFGVVVGGVLWVLAAGCASGAREVVPPSGAKVVIHVAADCTVDLEEAHISEGKKEQAQWELVGHGGPLAIEFKEDDGKKALEVTSLSATSATARIKTSKQQGRHPYRIMIGDKECPDPFIIIDG